MVFYTREKLKSKTIPLLVKQKIPLSLSYSLATAAASRGASGITSAQWKAKAGEGEGMELLIPENEDKLN